MAKSDVVEDLAVLISGVTGRTWEREYLFANKRNLACCPTFMTEYSVPRPRLYRFDFALPDLMMAVEYEGGVGQQTVAHSSVSGIIRDIEKHRLATMLGWMLLRFHSKEVRDGVAARRVEQAYDLRRWRNDADDEFYRLTAAPSLIRAGLAVPWDNAE